MLLCSILTRTFGEQYFGRKQGDGSRHSACQPTLNASAGMMAAPRMPLTLTAAWFTPSAVARSWGREPHHDRLHGGGIDEPAAQTTEAQQEKHDAVGRRQSDAPTNTPVTSEPMTSARRTPIRSTSHPASTSVGA